MAVSVVVPCKNVADTIGAQLEALTSQALDVPWEIVVVDDCSSDATASVVAGFQAEHPNIRLVRTSASCGAGAARNFGVVEARGTRLLMCDGDDVVANGWLRSMADAVGTHDLVVGALDTDTLNPPWLVRSRGGSSQCPQRFADLFVVASSGNLAVTRSAFERIGGFPVERDLRACEDIGFSLRALELGIEPFFEPSAIVRYRYQTRAGMLWRQGLAYGRGRVRAARLLRDRGHPMPHPLHGWRSWAWLLVHVADLRSENGRAVWAWVAGNRCGHAIGSVRWKVIQL